MPLLRIALRQHLLPPPLRDLERPAEIEQAIRWLARMSLPVSELTKPRQLRRALDAADASPRRLGGRTNHGASQTRGPQQCLAVRRRDRSARREQPGQRRLAPAQDVRRGRSPRRHQPAAGTRTAHRRHLHRSGRPRPPPPRLLRRHLLRRAAPRRSPGAARYATANSPTTVGDISPSPDHGPETNRRWTNTGTAHEERGLKHRPTTATRRVPIPPELVTLLRDHLAEFGTAPDGRLFHTRRGGVLTSGYTDTWAAARTLALTPDQVLSPLANRPYALRHAAVSLWLNAGVPATEVADRAGHSVEVLLRVYAGCIDGGETVANQRIDDALRESCNNSDPRQPPIARHLRRLASAGRLGAKRHRAGNAGRIACSEARLQHKITLKNVQDHPANFPRLSAIGCIWRHLAAREGPRDDLCKAL